MMLNMSDIAIVNYYKIEYAKEWYLAHKNGIKLTANDIRVRLNSK